MNKVEMYNEDLDRLIYSVHESCEGRNDLNGYELHVIEAALNELNELKKLKALSESQRKKKICVECGCEFDVKEIIIKGDIDTCDECLCPE